MKNNKTVLTIFLIVVVLGLIACTIYFRNKNTSPENQTPSTQTQKVVYKNTKYGFNFTLPASWKGYTIVENSWTGSTLTKVDTHETGPKLLIRNPKWTEALHYEDIPVMVFTLAQWDAYMAEKFSVSAAPFLASELSRNNVYVFALPPRWDFDYSEGYVEAQDILKTNALKAFDIGAEQASIKGCYVAKLAKDVYTLKINDQVGNDVSGTLAFKNFEKDSSSGTITGKYDKDILLLEYVFNSEGMQSTMQVIFKHVGDNFIRGFGETKMEGDKVVFKDLSKITYDNKSTFVKSPTCI